MDTIAAYLFSPGLSRFHWGHPRNSFFKRKFTDNTIFALYHSIYQLLAPTTFIVLLLVFIIMRFLFILFHNICLAVMQNVYCITALKNTWSIRKDYYLWKLRPENLKRNPEAALLSKVDRVKRGLSLRSSVRNLRLCLSVSL